MASPKCKTPRKALQRRNCPALTPEAPAGGIGGVAPDGGNSLHSGAAINAGVPVDNHQTATRPAKPVLCGQLNNGINLTDIRKSFSDIISNVEDTSYKVKDRGRLGRFSRFTGDAVSFSYDDADVLKTKKYDFPGRKCGFQAIFGLKRPIDANFLKKSL